MPDAKKKTSKLSVLPRDKEEEKRDREGNKNNHSGYKKFNKTLNLNTNAMISLYISNFNNLLIIIHHAKTI